MIVLGFNTADLEIDSIGSWPSVLRKMILVAIFFIVLIIGYFEDFSALLDQVKEQEAKIIMLENRYEDAHNKVANLNAYKKQMKDIEEIFNTLKKQLPTMSSSVNNDAALLEEISQQSFISGLQFRYMKPDPIIEKGFYIEYPLELSVSGSYHSIAEFISNVSNMPRIVTFHNFNISLSNPSANAPSGGQSTGVGILENPILLMNIQAKTYWAMNSLE